MFVDARGAAEDLVQEAFPQRAMAHSAECLANHEPTLEQHLAAVFAVGPGASILRVEAAPERRSEAGATFVNPS